MTSRARQEWAAQRAREEPARKAGHIPECPWPSDTMLLYRIMRAMARHPRMTARILDSTPRGKWELDA